MRPVNERPDQLRRKTPLDTMASGIAHELNNILYPIFIYANLLLKKAEPAGEDYSDLTEILKCANRAKDLITKIRTYSGRIESDKEIADVAEIVRDTAKSIRASGPSTVKFEEQICDQAVPVLCDASQVSQVLTNLCKNAVEAIPGAGTIRIALDSTTLDDLECLDGTRLSGAHAGLVVSDNGVGMNQATLARVFDPFFTTQKQAAGLGLSTATGIVRSHGGGICVTSKPDIGTTFEIFLPLAEGIAEQPTE